MSRHKNDSERLLDEFSRWIVTIPSAETVDTHTEYVVKVEQQIKPTPKTLASDIDTQSTKTDTTSVVWQLKRRYNDFRNLNSSLEQLSGEKDFLGFPGKKVTGNMDRDFIASRRVALEKFLQTIAIHPLLRNTLLVRQFLDPGTYSQNFQDIHLQNVTMCFRGVGNFEITKPIAGVGSRLKKDYFQVKFVVQGYKKKADELWLDWLDYGPEMAFSSDSILESKTLQSISKSLQQLEHPYIYPNENIEFHETGVITIKKFSSKGSLRDVLCNAKPKDAFYKKYFSSTVATAGKKSPRKFELNDVRTLGKQLLEALKFLHEKGIGHGNLHSGNVLFNTAKNIFQLTEIENYFAGVSCGLRQEGITLKAPSQSVEAFDVFCFGHLLYEISVGKPLYHVQMNSSITNNVNDASYNTAILEGNEALPNQLPDSLKIMLRSIISADACKDPASYPTIKSLLQDPFFNEVTIGTSDNTTRPYLKFSLNTKEALSKYKESIANQLQSGYMKAMTIRAESKRLEALQSKEGRKKRIKSKKIKSVGEEETNSKVENADTHLANSNTPHTTNNGNTSIATTKVVSNGVPPKAPPPPPPPVIESKENQPPAQPLPKASNDSARNALLGSISGFNKGKLKRCETVDKSAPKI